ncbi:MAG TPA: hypothetical protein PLQ13_14435, partial [Candidatus Krumholzibacteria bacterium]|nr:hypothetical protein [Candidatus Krumholzibacteria bacterium]
DAADQEEAAARPGLTRSPGELHLRFAGLELAQITGRGAADRARAACATADLVLTTVKVDQPDCPIWDVGTFRKSGAVALRDTPEGILVETVAAGSGRRPWSPDPPPPPPRLPSGTKLAQNPP